MYFNKKITTLLLWLLLIILMAACGSADDAASALRTAADAVESVGEASEDVNELINNLQQPPQANNTAQTTTTDTTGTTEQPQSTPATQTCSGQVQFNNTTSMELYEHYPELVNMQPTQANTLSTSFGQLVFYNYTNVQIDMQAISSAVEKLYSMVGKQAFRLNTGGTPYCLVAKSFPSRTLVIVPREIGRSELTPAQSHTNAGTFLASNGAFSFVYFERGFEERADQAVNMAAIFTELCNVHLGIVSPYYDAEGPDWFCNDYIVGSTFKIFGLESDTNGIATRAKNNGADNFFYVVDFNDYMDTALFNID